MEKKFTFVSHVLPPAWSGQAIVIGQMLRGVDPQTYCLIWTESKVRQNNGEFSKSLPAKYYHIPPMPMINRLERSPLAGAVLSLKVFQRAAQIAKILIREKCNTVVVGTGNLVDPPSAYYASQMVGADFYLYLFDDYVYQWIYPRHRIIAQYYERIMFQNTTGVIVPNEFMKAEIEKRQSVHATIVRNPCGFEPVIENSLQESTRDGIHIVFGGAIYHVNLSAFTTLITVFEQLGDKRIKLHIYTAQEKDWLASQGIRGDYVVFHPHVPYSEMVEIQRKAHILFLPYAFHSTAQEVIRTSAPGKLGDYLASGKPILAYAPPDTFVCWYLKQHLCGAVVDTEDINRLAQTIRQIINNKDLAQTLVSNAVRQAKTDYSLERNRKIFLDMILGES